MHFIIEIIEIFEIIRLYPYNVIYNEQEYKVTLPEYIFICLLLYINSDAYLILDLHYLGTHIA